MRKPKYTKLSVYLAACIFALANFAFGQNSVDLKGRVFDERGALFVGANVAPFRAFNPHRGDLIIPRNSTRGANVVSGNLNTSRIFITNFSEYNNLVTSPLFERPNCAAEARGVQLGVSLNF